MKLRILPVTMVAACSLFPIPAALAAPIFHEAPPSMVNLAKVKMVRFTVRNGSGEQMIVRTGERMLTLEPGQTVELKLQMGDLLTAGNTTTHYAAGCVLASVSGLLQGSTVVFN